MSSTIGLEPANSTALAIGGMGLTGIITVVATVALVASTAFFVAIAVGPHLSSDWADRFHGSTNGDYEGDSADAESTA